MPAIISRLILLLLFLPVSGQAQFESAYTRPLPFRILAVDSIYKTCGIEGNYESKAICIRSLKQLALKKKDEQIQLLADAYRSFLEIRHDPDKLDEELRKLFRIIQTCRLESYKELALRILTRTANLLSEHNRFSSGLVYMMKSEELYDQVDTCFWLESREAVRYDVVRGLYEIGDLERARDMTENSMLMDLSGHGAMMTWDLLSQIYLKLGDYTKSELNIQKGLDVYMVSDTNDWWFHGWRGIFEGYRGKIRYAQGDYHAALPYFLIAVDKTGEANMYNNITSFGLLAADCYVRLGQPEKARALLPKIRDAVYKQSVEQCFYDYYKLLLVLGEPSHDPLQMRETLDSVQFWGDRTHQEMDKNAYIRSGLETELQTFTHNEEKLKADIQHTRRIRTMLWIILGIAVTASVFLLFLKQQQIQINEKKIEDAHLELERFRQSMVEKSRQLESMYGPENLASKQELEQLYAQVILTEEDWIRFKQLFERVHVGYLTRLRTRYPDLTSGEIRLIALLRLSFTTKDMASVLGVGPGAIRTMKSRLIRKLDLTEEQTLEEMVQHI